MIFIANSIIIISEISTTFVIDNLIGFKCNWFRIVDYVVRHFAFFKSMELGEVLLFELHLWNFWWVRLHIFLRWVDDALTPNLTIIYICIHWQFSHAIRTTSATLPIFTLLNVCRFQLIFITCQLILWCILFLLV